MESDSTQTNKSKWAWFAFGAIVVALAAMVVVVVWPPLSLKTPTDMLVVKAIDGAIKVKPADPGGVTVPHQDLLVIDMLKSGLADAEEVETLQPRPSAPEPPPISAEKTDSAAADLVKDSATPVAKAWLSSAASTCTGIMPSSSAKVAVAVLYDRNLTPCVSFEDDTAFLK